LVSVLRFVAAPGPPGGKVGISSGGVKTGEGSVLGVGAEVTGVGAEVGSGVGGGKAAVGRGV
jgi:hypothetical protein